jgi:hypothetical protein
VIKTLMIGVAALGIAVVWRGPAWAQTATPIGLGSGGSGDLLAETAASLAELGAAVATGQSQLNVTNTMPPEGLSLGAGGIAFGDNTFRNQVLSVNQFQTGTNGTQMSSVSINLRIGGGS